MWKKELVPDRPHMNICCCIEKTRFACQITKARIQKLTNSMEQSSFWETNRFSASQITHFLWSPKVHYCICKGPPPFPIVSQVNPVDVSPSHFLQIRFNIILPSAFCSFEMVSFHQISPPQPCIHLSCPHTCHMHGPSHSFWFGHPNNIW